MKNIVCKWLKWNNQRLCLTCKVLLAEVYPEEEVSVPEAAYRWIYNNSKLSGEKGDCVIIGASR